MKLLVILFLLTNSPSLLLETAKLAEISRIKEFIKTKDNTGHFCQRYGRPEISLKFFFFYDVFTKWRSL